MFLTIFYFKRGTHIVQVQEPVYLEENPKNNSRVDSGLCISWFIYNSDMWR